MSKPYVSDREYLRKARILKKFGLINYNVAPGTKLTTGQKAQVTKLTSSHKVTLRDKNDNTKIINRPPLKALIEHPEYFKTRKIPKSDEEKWRSAGYMVINNHVVVRGEEGAKITIKPNRIIIKRKAITEEVLILSLPEFLDKAKTIFKKKLKKGEYVMFSIGKFGIFNRKFMHFEDLENYILDLLGRMGVEEDDIDTVQLQLVHGTRNKK